MQLPGRIAAAIEVLATMAKSHRPASLVLKDWGQSHRFAGSGDRAAIGNLVYDALRRRASHAFLMDEDSPRAIILSVAVRDWGEDPKALAEAFSSDKFGPADITENERTRLSALPDAEQMPGHIRADLPQWLVPSLQIAFGEDWVQEGMALGQRPSLDMRVNTLKSDRERVQKALQRFSPAHCEFAPHGLRISAGVRDARTSNVQADQSYLKGWFEIQDEGSQLVTNFAQAKPGDQVLDYCAGAGGKSLGMAAAMQNKGQIFAHDADRARLAPIYDRILRAGARNIQTRPPEPGALGNLMGKMDLVLVDAPCTGTGTWRRRPDTKWRLTQEQLNQRVGEQAEILDQAAQYVRPGGRLTYITCSVLPEENGDQIQKFLAAHPDFSADESAPPDALPQRVAVSEGMILLSPQRCATDGFFAANVTKRA